MTHPYIFILCAGIAVGIFNATLGALPYEGWNAIWIALGVMTLPAIGMAWAY